MKNTALYFLLLASITWSCQKEHMGDCFKSTGSIKTEERQISNFSHLDLYDRINLNYYYSNDYKVEVLAGENLIEGIETKVKNGILSIENKNRCNWMRSFKKEVTVKVFAPQFNRLTYHGSGKVTFVDTLKTNEFYLNLWDASGNMDLKFHANLVSLKTHTAPGVIRAAGKCNELIAYLGGNGKIAAPNLQSQKALVINKNTGNILINCQSKLTAEIKGSGNIEYIGSPLIDFSREGSGELIKVQ